MILYEIWSDFHGKETLDKMIKEDAKSIKEISDLYELSQKGDIDLNGIWFVTKTKNAEDTISLANADDGFYYVETKLLDYVKRHYDLKEPSLEMIKQVINSEAFKNQLMNTKSISAEFDKVVRDNTVLITETEDGIITVGELDKYEAGDTLVLREFIDTMIERKDEFLEIVDEYDESLDYIKETLDTEKISTELAKEIREILVNELIK